MPPPFSEEVLADGELVATIILQVPLESTNSITPCLISKPTVEPCSFQSGFHSDFLNGPINIMQCSRAAQSMRKRCNKCTGLTLSIIRTKCMFETYRFRLASVQRCLDSRGFYSASCPSGITQAFLHCVPGKPSLNNSTHASVLLLLSGLAISAFARAGQVLCDEECMQRAVNAARFIELRMYNPVTGRLKRNSYRHSSG